MARLYRWPNRKLTPAEGERMLWHALEYLRSEHLRLFGLDDGVRLAMLTLGELLEISL